MTLPGGVASSLFPGQTNEPHVAVDVVGNAALVRDLADPPGHFLFL